MNSRKNVTQDLDFEEASCYEDALCEDSKAEENSSTKRREKILAITFTSHIFQTLIDEETTISLPSSKPDIIDVETNSDLLECFASFVGEIKRNLINDTASKMFQVLQ